MSECKDFSYAPQCYLHGSKSNLGSATMADNVIYAGMRSNFGSF